MRLKMAMIGGGEGSFIGPVHRIAASMDGLIELVSGAFSSDPERSVASGLGMGLKRERIHDDWRSLIKDEAGREKGDRADLISIVTPNHLHFEPAMAALESGFHVVCDKPLCMTSSEAIMLKEAVARTGRLFCLTHNYTGYPMVKKARELVAAGKLGKIRKVAVEYFQGWLSELEEQKGNRQALWRADPSRAGVAGCMADIGTHAFNLAEYITGSRVERLYAQLNRFGEGRVLDDDGSVILNFSNGIKGTLLASQVALGEENNLRIKVYGTNGSLAWEQMNPNSLTVRWKDQPYQVYRSATGFNDIGAVASSHSRLPAGHPEGFIEAFANLYRNFALAVISSSEGKQVDPAFDFPGIGDGLRGMLFLEAVVESSGGEKWSFITP